MIVPPRQLHGFELLEVLNERRKFLDGLRYSYNIDTDIYNEITKAMGMIDEAILLNLKIITNK